MKLDAPVVLDFEGLLKGIGPRMAAVVSGITDARVLVGWRDDPQTIPQEARERLLTAQEFVKVFGDSGDNATIATAYMRGSWPELNDAAPAVVIREGDADARAHLLAVASRVARDGGGY